MPSTKMHYAPGVINLKTCLLFNYNKKALDIRHLMVEFNIFHDIYTHGTKCELVIIDGNGIVEMMPIVGEEKLLLEFSSPMEGVRGAPKSRDKVLTYVFQIYKIDDKQKLEPRTERVTLHGVTQETVNNARTTVEKSFVDQTSSTIIKTIYEKYLKPKEEDFIMSDKKNKIVIQKVKHNMSVVFPRLRPYDAIRYICQETYHLGKLIFETYQDNELIKPEDPPANEITNNSQSSNFVFFQKSDGWYFQTLDSLLIRPVENFNNFYLSGANYAQIVGGRLAGDFRGASLGAFESVSTSTKVFPFQIIIDVNLRNQFDTLESSINGLYSSFTETIDPLLKEFTRESFVYADKVKNMNHLEQDKSQFGSNFIFTDNSLYRTNRDPGIVPMSPPGLKPTNKKTSARSYVASNIGENYSQLPIFGNARETDPRIRNPRNIHKYIHYNRASRLKLASNIVLNVTIPGNILLEIGDVVNLHFPQTSPIEEYMKKLNLLYDKKFLVTAIRHVYNKQKNHFFTVMQCVKDTYAKPLVEEPMKE